MRLAIIIITTILLAGCKYSYRYPCQDPANWGKEWCSNDVCKADGTCSDKVLGFTPKPNQDINPVDLANTMGDENVKTPKMEISTQQPAECKPTVAIKEKKEIEFRPARTVETHSEKLEETLTEKPVTMDTIVDTTAHNNATKLNR